MWTVPSAQFSLLVLPGQQWSSATVTGLVWEIFQNGITPTHNIHYFSYSFYLQDLRTMQLQEDIHYIALSIDKGSVHILGKNCPRSDPHMAHMGYYLGPHMYKYTQVMWMHANIWPPGGAFDAIFTVEPNGEFLKCYQWPCCGPITSLILTYELYYDRIQIDRKYLRGYWAATPLKVKWSTHFLAWNSLLEALQVPFDF